ncbi:hypothetical protein EV147_2382 [Cupriavidus agavae]|uniref:Uncharacterized protein n=1 Tax=Cupriavidus agavae TaxID=1001822 RepID=A0A4Q7S0K0_9BURK|nr:hypothetical protein EV147_2382 [Cupriavidus agavae]
MKAVKDEDFPASLRQRGDALFQMVDDLPVRDGLRHIGGEQAAFGRVCLSCLGMVLAGPLRSIAVDGAVGGDMPEEGQRLGHLAGRGAFEQLHAHVLQHVPREMPVTEAPANVIDQFVVVTQQGGEQRRMGGVAQHGQGR